MTAVKNPTTKKRRKSWISWCGPYPVEKNGTQKAGLTQLFNGKG